MKKVGKTAIQILISAGITLLLTFIIVQVFWGNEEHGIKMVYGVVAFCLLFVAVTTVVTVVSNTKKDKKEWAENNSNEKCCACGKQLEYKSFKTKLSNGYVCYDCLRAVGLSLTDKLDFLNKENAARYINHAKSLKDKFSITQNYDDNFSVDENNKIIMANGQYLDYSQIVDYELFENDESVYKGGMSGAVIGGILAGGAGALIGAAAKSRKSKSTCDMMKLRLTVRNYLNNYIDIVFIKSEVYKSSGVYKAAEQRAQNCISALKLIADNGHSKNSNVSAADEILKYKQLLDCGAITDEEFNAKKAELLNL